MSLVCVTCVSFMCVTRGCHLCVCHSYNVLQLSTQSVSSTQSASEASLSSQGSTKPGMLGGGRGKREERRCEGRSKIVVGWWRYEGVERWRKRKRKG